MNAKIILSTDRFQLAQLDRSYAAAVCHYLKTNEDHFRNSRGLYPEAYFTTEQQSLILEMESRRSAAGKGFRFYLLSPDGPSKDGEIIGDVHFNEIVRGAFQSCFVGYKVSKEHCGQGIMSEALSAAAQHMFQAYDLHRIEANIMPSNLASIRVAEKCGFQAEGLAKNFLKINGQWEDHRRFALLNEAN